MRRVLPKAPALALPALAVPSAHRSGVIRWRRMRRVLPKAPALALPALAVPSAHRSGVFAFDGGAVDHALTSVTGKRPCSTSLGRDFLPAHAPGFAKGPSPRGAFGTSLGRDFLPAHAPGFAKGPSPRGA